MLFSDIKSCFTFKNFENFVINLWNDDFRKSRVLLNKLDAMVRDPLIGGGGEVARS